MPRYKRKGVTLTEVIVVIAIMGILMAVGAPMYTSYMTKSKIAEVFAAINQYKAEMQVAYNGDDQFPSSFLNFNEYTYTSLGSATLQQVYYGRVSDGQISGYLLFYTQDLGIPGFVLANGSGSGGVSGRIALSAQVSGTGEVRFYCGQWEGNAADVPLNYLPASCQDTNLKALTIPTR